MAGKNADVVSCEVNENKRNLLITKATCLQAETGLILGKTQESVRNCLFQRLEEFKQAFWFDQKREKIETFFANAFVGPPCFNGRLITLQEYIVTQQNRISTYAFDRNLDIDKEACQLENIIYNYQTLSGNENIPDFAELQTYLLSQNLVELAHHIRLNEIYRRACEFVESNRS